MSFRCREFMEGSFKSEDRERGGDVEVLKNRLQELVESGCTRENVAELKGISNEVIAIWENSENQKRLHNPEVLKNLMLTESEKKDKGAVNGIIMPGGGLACVGQFGIFRWLIEHVCSRNIDHIVASSGSAWVAAGFISAEAKAEVREKIKALNQYVSIFTRDLRGKRLLPGTIQTLWRLMIGEPIADLQLVHNITSGKKKGIDYHERHYDDQATIGKVLDVENVRSKDNPIHLHIATTEAQTRESVYFEAHEIEDNDKFFNILAASSSFPVIFGKPQQIGEKELEDGDLSMDWVEKAKELGINSLLISLPEPPDRPIEISEAPRLFPEARRQLANADFRNEVRYLLNLVNTLEYAREHNVYVLAPDLEFLVQSENSKHRGSKLHALYKHMYSKVKRAYEILYEA